MLWKGLFTGMHARREIGQDECLVITRSERLQHGKHWPELGCERRDDSKIETFQGKSISVFLSQSEGFIFWRTNKFIMVWSGLPTEILWKVWWNFILLSLVLPFSLTADQDQTCMFKLSSEKKRVNDNMSIRVQQRPRLGRSDCLASLTNPLSFLDFAVHSYRHVVVNILSFFGWRLEQVWIKMRDL